MICLNAPSRGDAEAVEMRRNGGPEPEIIMNKYSSRDPSAKYESILRWACSSFPVAIERSRRMLAGPAVLATERRMVDTV
jgi:hypothetical protein